MIDIHSHVLYGIDDGAQTIEDSLAILARAEKIGITKMIATPHFTIGEDVDKFIAERDKRLEALKKAAREKGIKIELYPGAEVYITDELYNECDLKKLTLAGSDIILAEFKYHSLRAESFLDYIDELINQGVRAVIAHPERYSYFIRNPRLVNAVIDRGAMLQINAISLFEDSEEGEAARMMLNSRIVYAIGSDIHHASSKRLEAVERLNESGKLEKYLTENPKKILM